MEKQTDTLGIVGMILGIVGLVVGIFTWLALILGVPSLILGTLGFKKDDTKTKGFSVASLTLGTIATIWFIFMFCIFMIALTR